MDEKKLNLIGHLSELRRRLIISLMALGLGMVFCFVFWQDILLSILVAPLAKLEHELVLHTVTEGFLLNIKLAFLGGFLTALPVILAQLISFVLPALYKKERKIFWSLFITSLCLFTGGVVFAYQFVLGLGLKFLLVDFSGGLTPMISAVKYVSFVTSFLIPFGIIFEIPIATYILTKVGLITPTKLRQNRRYVVLIIFILAAILTPPDVLSQILLALPMLVLYEISIIIAIFVNRRKKA